MSSPSFYSVGGPLLQDDPSYLTRESDTELYETLKAGKFCYVLNSRQMGKSSLMVRTLAKLEADGWVGSIIDFSGKDSQVDRPDRWYNGIINQLNNQFELLEWQTFRTWLKERDFISPVERLADFIDKVLLPGTEKPIVIFIDEIDSTLGLPFTDDFFALIRVCFNKRPQNFAYKRLTFALLGVAAPSELIGDVKRTPFNIGESIDLKGFTFEEALPLAAGLQGRTENPETVLQEILRWTGGQPFLTQRLCQLVVDSSEVIAAGSEAVTINGLVESRLIDNWEAQDNQEHLKTIRKRLLDDEQKAGYLLELYRQIRQAKETPANNQPEERELQLSGLTVKRDSKLRVYNPIYTAIFDETWIDAELRKLRPYAENFRAWIVSEKVDNSRLLRGGALTEAEAWASEKTTLSAEDREFLSASRAQQREEEISAREQEAELSRERTAREAAEAAEQIQAEATQAAQRKIRRGSLVLAGALVSAFALGGLALFSGKQLSEAKDDFAEIQAQKEQVDQQRKQAQQQAKAAQEESNQANKDLEKSQENLETLELQRQVAGEQLKQAQRAAQGQQALLVQLEQNLADADAAVAQAKQAEQDAQQRADQAQSKVAAINTHIDTVNELSSLVGELYGQNKSGAAGDAIEHIGLSFTDFTVDSPELKQALLNSSIALAHLHLIPFPWNDTNGEAQKQVNDAQTRIEQSVRLIETNPNVFNSFKSGQFIAFFTYAVHGNILEKVSNTFPDEIYEQAFSYFGMDSVITQGNLPSNYIRLLDSFYESEEVNGTTFRTATPDLEVLFPIATASLGQYYDVRIKQWISKLESALTKREWKEADRLTWEAMAFAYQASILSLPRGDRRILFGTIDYGGSCEITKEIDRLWYEYSRVDGQGRFGFRVQKEIYFETGNDWTADLNNEDIWLESRRRWANFAEKVGWKEGGRDEQNATLAENEIDQGRFLEYDELDWGSNSYLDEKIRGHLPALGFWALTDLHVNRLAVPGGSGRSPSISLGREIFSHVDRCEL